MAIDAHPRPVESLRIELVATAERLAEIRHRLATWLAPTGLSPTGIADILLVVNEACTNCIEHAYRGLDRGLIRLHADRDGKHIVVDVADDGAWQPPANQPSTRGRGLPIMRAVSDGVDLKPSPEGTTVRMRFDTSR